MFHSLYNDQSKMDFKTSEENMLKIAEARKITKDILPISRLVNKLNCLEIPFFDYLPVSMFWLLGL